MDYTSDPEGPPSNEHPNQHDYDQLETIYGHPDSYDSYGTGRGGGGGGCNAPPGQGCNKLDVGDGNSRREWGLSLGRRGAHESFIRIDPDGTRHVTFVTWAVNG